MSIPRALLLALALLQAVGITDYVRRVACEEECKTDGCGDKGLCDSSTCACHCAAASSFTHVRFVTTHEVPPGAASMIVFADADGLRASPDPREILHVPKRLAV